MCIVQVKAAATAVTISFRLSRLSVNELLSLPPLPPSLPPVHPLSYGGYPFFFLAVTRISRALAPGKKNAMKDAEALPGPRPLASGGRHGAAAGAGRGGGEARDGGHRVRPVRPGGGAAEGEGQVVPPPLPGGAIERGQPGTMKDEG